MSGLNYQTVKDSLMMAYGKSNLKKSYGEHEAGDTFTQHVAGTHQVARYEIVGFSGPELEAALMEGPRWKDEMDYYDHDTAVLKDKDGHFHIWTISQVEGAKETNKLFSDTWR